MVRKSQVTTGDDSNDPIKPTVFESLITKFNANGNELKGTLSTRIADQSIAAENVDFVSFNRPTQVLVSRWYPGYRVTDLTGADAQESLGFLLADEIKSESTLGDFQRLLGNPSITNSIITELLPRKGVPVRRDQYLVTEDMIGEVTKTALQAFGEERISVISSIAYVVTRVLSHLELVLPSPDRKVVKVSSSFAVTPNDLRRFIMVDSLRDLFSDARLSDVKRALTKDSTPEIIGEVISRMLRTASNSIPEIILKLEQIETVQQLVHRYHVDPRALSQAMQAYSGLQQLADYANFAVWAAKTPLSGFIDQNNSDLKDACDNILSVINSAPSIEAMALNKYFDHFGFIPANASGIYRGAVVYQTKSQTSKMDVLQTTQKGDSWLVNQQPIEYIPVSRIADELNRSFLDPRSLGGLANLVADEMALQPFQLGEAPILNTIGVNDEDIMYLAMSVAETLSFVQVSTSRKKGVAASGSADIVFGVNVAEQFIMNVGAASPGTAFFSDPVAVLLYGLGDEYPNSTKDPVPLPARKQSFDLPVAADVTFKGDLRGYISNKIETPFKIKLPMEVMQTNGKSSSIDMVISVLSVLLPPPDKDGNVNIVESGVHYSSINEPGVDGEAKLMLALVNEYQQFGNRVLADRARSWIVETLGNAMQHPTIVSMATKAVNRSLIAQKFDGRRLKSQFGDLMIMAYFSTLMAVLSRFNKVQPQVAEDLIMNIPVPSLSVKASALLLSMPLQLNASSLYSGN